MRASYKKAITCSVLALGFLLFQNCGESLDLNALDQSSFQNGAIAIIGQSESQTVVEGQRLELFVSLRNLSGTSDPNFNVRWTRNNQEVQSGTSLNLIIPNTDIADQGAYVAQITGSDDISLTSAPIVVSVTDDIENRPGFSRNGVKFALYNSTVFTQERQAEIALAYCRAHHGPAARLVGYTVGTTSRTDANYSILVSNGCNVTSGTYRGQVGDFCLYSVSVGFNHVGFTRIQCQN